MKEQELNVKNELPSPHKEYTSPHILNASSSLLGLCFVVLTSLKVMGLSGKTYIDEFTSISLFLFMAGSIISFLSIRSSRKKVHYEKLAEIVFLLGLFTLFIITLLVTFNGH